MDAIMQVKIAEGLLAEVGYRDAKVDYHDETGIVVSGNVPIEILAKMFVLLGQLTPDEDVACYECYVNDRAGECIDGYCTS